MNNFFYKVNDKEYEVEVIYKRMKNIHYRFKDGKFVISCSRLTPKSTLLRGLEKYGASLIKRSSKTPPIGEGYIYLFGEKVEIAPAGLLRIEGYKEIKYKTQEELLKKLRPIFLDIVTKRVRYYEKIMGLPSYQVSVRNMSTRYGSNSKGSKRMNFALVLIHYSYPILDSVIVHELAHIKVFNHSKEFYDVVYKYYPQYDECHKKLRKGEFK